MPLVSGEDNSGLVYRSWVTGNPCASAVLIHGLGAHSGRWEGLAESFVSHGISSFAIDLKGFGLTKTQKGHVGSFKEYFEEIKQLCRLARRLNPNVKVFCIGESMGALLVFLLATEDAEFCDGIILISPAFGTKIKLTAWDYIRVFGALFYNSNKTFDLPFTSFLCTRDIDYQRKIDTDERECHVATAQLLTRILLAQIQLFFIKKSLNIPVLFLLAGDDRIINTKTSKKLFTALKASDKQLIEYDGMYHALSIDLGKRRVFDDAAAWIKKRG